MPRALRLLSNKTLATIAFGEHRGVLMFEKSTTKEGT